MVEQNKADVILKYLLLSAVCLYLLVFSHLGFSVDDGGYLYGAGWRILNGEQIYIDYIYARTPLSPFISAFLQQILPDVAEYLNIRKIFYIEVYLYSFFMMMTLNYFLKYDLKKIALISIGVAMINAHFNNYLWHTTDGLLFLSIGAYFAINRNYMSSIFIILALMTKQSFAPAVFLIPLSIFLIDKKFSVFLFLNNVVFLILFIALWYIVSPETLEAFMNLKQETSQISEGLRAGVVVYIVNAFFAVIPVFLVFIIKNRKRFDVLKKIGKDSFSGFFIFAKYVNLYILMFGLAGVVFTTVFFAKIIHIEYSLIMLLVFIENLIDIKNRKKIVVVLIILFIAWMSSLSWGYQTPAFAIGPVLFIYFQEIYQNIKKQIVVLMLLMFIALPSLLLQKSIEIRNLGVISEKLDGIYVSKDKFEKILDIDKRVEECNGSWIVFPDYTFIKYAKNSTPEAKLDWISNVEAMNKKKDILEELNHIDCLITNENYRFKDDKKFGWN